MDDKRSILKKSTPINSFNAELSASRICGIDFKSAKVRLRPSPDDIHMVFADSFGRKLYQFLEKDMLDETFIPIPPHRNDRHSKIIIKNNSEGSRKLADGLREYELRDILRFQPKSILIMLGMVDIASQRAGEVLFDCGWYKRTMIEVVTSAKQQLRDMCGEDGEALLFVNKLVFHFAYLPTWGNNFTPFRGNINTADVKYCRKMNMQIAIRFCAQLAEDDIILVDLNVNNPTREDDDLHYDHATSRKLFGRMKRFFFRFACDTCGFFNRRPLPVTRRNVARESKALVFAPSCEGDIVAAEAIDDAMAN